MASFEQIEEYAERYIRALSDLHARLWNETHKKTDNPGMMVGPLEGALLRLLVRLTAAKRVLEIGMFTGYSALAMAEALPENGQLITCDVNPRPLKSRGAILLGVRTGTRSKSSSARQGKL